MLGCNIFHALQLVLIFCNVVYAQNDSCNGSSSSLGDGRCHLSNNNKLCNYDEGDCCECTCGRGSSAFDWTLYYCDSPYNIFSCLDPTSDCLDPRAIVYPNCTGFISLIKNGDCDRDLNNLDCCECICVDGPDYSCGNYSDISCLDPDSGCVSQIVAEFSNCTGDLAYAGDGSCDDFNNNPACGFDWGDCCICTFVEDADSDSLHYFLISSYYRAGFECLDPNAGDDLYGCMASPPPPFPCSGDSDDKLVVEWLADVNILVETVYCTGGEFEVEWKGHIMVDQDIVVPTGTMLNITGIGSNATIDGGGVTSLFTVLNGTLHVTNLSMTNGNSVFGGAIYSSGSTLTFHETSFVGNVASVSGGALLVTDGSNVYFRETIFSANKAPAGGAVHLSNARALWQEATIFSANTADYYGGAVHVSDGGDASWVGVTTFSGNIANYSGGAVHVTGGGNASWIGETIFSGNTAGSDGGALYLDDGCEASWTRVMTFSGNIVENDDGAGGTVHMTDDGNASWVGETIFSGNTAGSDGGALIVSYGGEASWAGVMRFSGNVASSDGGAMHASYGSEVWWAGETTFSRNLADKQGGAVSIMGTIHCSSTAKVTFRSNIAVNAGGALYIGPGQFSWCASTLFFNNTANVGGALFVGGGIFWGVDTLFSKNTADLGGALFVVDGANVVLNGETNFTANTAFSDGGAVGSSLLSDSNGYYATVDDPYFGFNDYTTVDDSVLIFNGPVYFLNNSAGKNGGGMALLGTLSVLFNTTNVTFFGNVANVTGGGVHLYATAVGPTFNRTKFDSNYAQMGGGVYASGSGTQSEEGEYYSSISDYKMIYYPVTFIGCIFINNVAEISGGAVMTASGRNKFLETSFVLNLARVGGALRLAGESSLDACSFVENMSDLDQGPAVSNLGSISNFTAGYFKDNKYICEAPNFFNFTELQKEELFGKVCYGCQDTQCKGCNFEEPNLMPQCISLFEAGIEHANSSGGLSTVEDLLIFKGYWRATNTSTDVKKCYNANACPGGLTTGNCNPGYRGPCENDCAVCRQGYVASLGFTCNKCSDDTRGIAPAFVFTVMSVAVLASAVWYLISSETQGGRWGVVGQVIRRLPVQSVKIIIVSWQILTQFASVANVTFPNVYQDFLDGVNVLNFDLSWVVLPGCFMNYNFYSRLLLTTIGPIGTVGLLGVTYAIAERRNRASEIALRTVRQKHASAALLMAFLLYSNVSSVVFQTFSCDPLDDGHSYLRADYSIECYNKEYRAYRVYATIMIFVYPVGIPALFAGLLFRNKQVLQDSTRSKEDLVTKSTMSLWEPYKPSRFYYEVTEYFRRTLLTGVVVFIYPGSAAQITVTYMIATVFAMIAEILSPYKSEWDAWVSRAGHALVVTSMYLALLLKVDVSHEHSSSEKIFEIILVAAHACVVVVIVVDVVAVACALKETRERLDPIKRTIHPCKIDATLVDANRSNDALNGESDVEHKAELEK